MLRHPLFKVITILTAAYLLSFSLRSNGFKNTPQASNIEASYHTLLTVIALDQNPVSSTWLLPSITLRGNINHDIPWGATIATETGNYLYTSFYSPSFLIAYIYFQVTGLEPTINNLALLNAIIGYLTVLILSLFLFFLIAPQEKSNSSRILVVSSCCLIAIFSREALLSTGLIYWAQSVFNLYLAIMLLAILCFIRHRDTFPISIIILLTFIGPLIEWTGFVLNIGLICLFARPFNNFCQDYKIALTILLTTFLSGALIVFHFTFATGLSTTIDAFTNRFLARSTTEGSFTMLLEGYVNSYGLFLFILLACSLLLIYKQLFTKHTIPKEYIVLLLISITPLIENIIMLQHATEFSFDRLKFIFPFAIICVISLSSLKSQGVLVACFICILASIFNYTSYNRELLSNHHWNLIHEKNLITIKEAKARIDFSCALIATSSTVRGYYNLLMNRNLYEWKTYHEGLSYYDSDKHCGYLYIKAEPQKNDLTKLISIKTLSNSEIKNK